MIESFNNKKAATWALLALLGTLLVVSIAWINPFASLNKNPNSISIPIDSLSSIIHVGSHDSFATTKEGYSGGKLLLEALETKDLTKAKAASDLYQQIIPKENLGGEYTALQWFADYLLADPAKQKATLTDKYVTSTFNFFADNDYARLKEYLMRKYKLGEIADRETEAGTNRKAFLEDFILFNNPRREEWERTSKIVASLNLKKGDKIADIGSGPGNYSFRFAEAVGEQGKVYAIDTVKDHTDYVKSTSAKLGVKNIQTVTTDGDTIGVPAGSVDHAYMCSLYHNIYGLTKEESRTSFVKSIYAGLKPGGSLVVVDNALVDRKKDLPYHGPYIAKELIIGQLKFYGFQFVKDYSFTPQRYVLVFKKPANG
jgi:ubiquinone/menaquinone biosynthesis C-methylase UbiE